MTNTQTASYLEGYNAGKAESSAEVARLRAQLAASRHFMQDVGKELEALGGKMFPVKQEDGDTADGNR